MSIFGCCVGLRAVNDTLDAVQGLEAVRKHYLLSPTVDSNNAFNGAICFSSNELEKEAWKVRAHGQEFVLQMKSAESRNKPAPSNRQASPSNLVKLPQHSPPVPIVLAKYTS